jgi:acyl-CoA thioester hydrolase
MSEPRGVTCRSELRVRYSETDQMGVVYHAHYLVWCEVARTDFIRTFGPSYADLERQGIYLAVTEANVRYHASARYDDCIRIQVWLESVQRRAITFGYRISRPDGEGAKHLATASTRLVAIGNDGRPRPLPADLLERLRAAVG